jgi:hypothetical protein
MDVDQLNAAMSAHDPDVEAVLRTVRAKQHARRRRWLVLGAGVVTGLLLVSAAALLRRDDDGPSRPAPPRADSRPFPLRPWRRSPSERPDGRPLEIITAASVACPRIPQGLTLYIGLIGRVRCQSFTPTCWLRAPYTRLVSCP